MILLAQNDGTSGGKHVKFGVPRGGAVKEKFCKETPLEAKELVDPRYTSDSGGFPCLTCILTL